MDAHPEETMGLLTFPQIILGPEIYYEIIEPWYQSQYQNSEVPWEITNPIEFGEPICFDGLVVHYYSDWSESTKMGIMVEEEWDIPYGQCEYNP